MPPVLVPSAGVLGAVGERHGLITVEEMPEKSAVVPPAVGGLQDSLPHDVAVKVALVHLAVARVEDSLAEPPAVLEEAGVIRSIAEQLDTMTVRLVVLPGAS